MLVVSAFTFDHFSKEWRREPLKRRSLKRRLVPLTAGVCIYLMVWGAYFYFNGKITDGDGDEVPIYEALNNVFNSPWWTDLKQSLIDTWNYAGHHGWYETYKQVLESLDVDGEQNAFKVNRHSFHKIEHFSIKIDVYNVVLVLDSWIASDSNANRYYNRLANIVQRESS